jgi:hypothetical protein
MEFPPVGWLGRGCERPWDESRFGQFGGTILVLGEHEFVGVQAVNCKIFLE